MTLNKSKWINRRAADWLGFSELAGLLQKDWRGEILYADGLSGAQKKQNCWMTVNVELSSHLSSSSQILLSLGTNFIFAFCQSFAEYQFCLKKKVLFFFFPPSDSLVSTNLEKTAMKSNRTLIASPLVTEEALKLSLQIWDATAELALVSQQLGR